MLCSGKYDDKRLLGRTRYRSKDIIKTGYKEIELGLDYSSGYGQVAGCGEHDSGSSCSLKDRKFVGQFALR